MAGETKEKVNDMPVKNPIQPLEKDHLGTMRFKANAIVRRMVDEGDCVMNKIAFWHNISADDRQQFAQLIGYSLTGYGELSYVDDHAYDVAERLSRQDADERDARIAQLEEELYELRNGLREPIARLFGVHPDELGEGDP